MAATPKTTYFMLDYENVQPKNLSLLGAGGQFRVMVFLGKTNVRLPVDLVTAMQSLGERGEYVRMDGSGPNALDFHIAYYMGRIAATDPNASFHIVSKDAGFDPLIAHVMAQGFSAKRTATVEAAPVLKTLTKAPDDEQVEAVIKNLRGMPKNRPQREKTLRTMISAWFGKPDDERLDRIVAELVKRGIVAFDGGKVKYALKA